MTVPSEDLRHPGVECGGKGKKHGFTGYEIDSMEGLDRGLSPLQALIVAAEAAGLSSEHGEFGGDYTGL